ncbi:hypothetical protein Poli38472_012642 [Pythium oligandrum]|uniref:beta-glucosidase n=1 Tax=Pythium oligandrum TaxID=41045 RepID=A0A8K1CEM5_PYTOL|nr:hypothetical protein Poli38472_012642 [Pythium oligandrum]|eukprot:TMW61451.1 hypothetical protein Poli38472_012642 [Pythium oligandrum]
MAQELRFPDNFIWGTATASYQIEGATDEGGRGDSIWDAFARTPGKVINMDTGARADDHYHRYKEDVQHMKSMGLKNYRFSIAWPRIIPAGVGAVNEEGVAFYNNLINELLANGIEPLITLYHWDLPLALQTEYDGWLGGEFIQNAFVEYARVCFDRFGDRVKRWLTFNEPYCATYFSYGTGIHAPGRKHKGSTEAYIAAHNMLLAHAKAVDLYRKEFQPRQNGAVGITLVSEWREPAAATDPQEQKRNAEAAERAVLFMVGWFADPVYLGDYPQVMKDCCGDRLPSFTDDEKKLLKGSSDFFGLNHYSTFYTRPSKAYLQGVKNETTDITLDEGAVFTSDPSWEKTEMGWNVVPWGLEKILLWVQNRYNCAGGIYITENGCAVADKTKEDAMNDDFRVNFYKAYLSHVHKAIQQGADVRGYYAWSLMDNYEWSEGYAKRFGLIWVNYETMERTLKKSAHAYSDIVRKNAVTV